MTGNNLTVEVEDLRFQRPQLGAESKEAGPGNLRQPLVAYIGDHIEQLFNAITSDRCDNAKLSKMGTDRIDHRRLLANEQMACAMEHQAALLLPRLGRHEPHVWPGDRLADGLSIGGIILLSLDVRLDVGRRHQAHRMTKTRKFAGPIMRGGAGFNSNEARRQLLDEWQNVAALELAANEYITCSVNPVDLKNRFGDVEADCRNSLHV